MSWLSVLGETFGGDENISVHVYHEENVISVDATIVITSQCTLSIS